MTERIDSDRAPAPVGAYPHARRGGGLLFLSGVGPRKAGTTDVPGVTLNEKGQIVGYDVEAQCRSCFDNVRMILEDSGSSMKDVVDVLAFLTDMDRDFATYNRVYAEYFAEGPDAPCPTRTTIEIKSLPQGGNAPICVEVKVVASVE